ncbi:hypothetical protein HOLleu_11568 [Holothuria leucospilota]|uniref:Uncharacterized protein n=1 Tax=Holothuria leucospilota TaxID=206669 RepID=A0A9Q1CGC7_HOLLE|nr:hypothetical protein HOLleu_11568 [Holothuria leucospilota]
MDEGTFRSTPMVHPMERRSKFYIADENNVNNCIHSEEENRELLNMKMKRRKSEGRLPLRSLNRSKRQMKGATERKLRTVRKAWGSFKAKVNPKSRRRPSREWTTSLATPKTPSTRQQLINSPLPVRPSPPTTDSSSVKSPGWRLYRNFDKTPSTPKSPYSKVRRRSERIAGRNKTPVSRRENCVSTSGRRISIGASPEGTLNSRNTSTMSIDVSAAFQEVIARMEALNEGLATFEKMSTSLTESIKAQDSKVEPPQEQTSSKSLRRQSSSFLRRSLRIQVS